MAKQYKAGQLITIDRRVYRVRKIKEGDLQPCQMCEFALRHFKEYPCWNLCLHEEEHRKLPVNLYLRLVKI